MEIRTVGLPQFVRPVRRLLKHLARRQHDEGPAGDQVEGFQNARDARFREERPLPVRELPGQFPRRALGHGQGEVDDLLSHPWWDAIPVPPRSRRAGREPIQSALGVAAIPRVERRARHLDLAERLPDGQIRAFDQANDFGLLGRRPSHVSSPESEAVRFLLSRRFSRTISATSCFRRLCSLRRSVTSGAVASRLVSPTRRFLPASRNSLLHR